MGQITGVWNVQVIDAEPLRTGSIWGSLGRMETPERTDHLLLGAAPPYHCREGHISPLQQSIPPLNQ